MKSRPQILWDHLNAMFNGTSKSWGTIATAVRECYEQQVPEHARNIEWSSNPDSYTRQRLNAQTLRHFEEEIKFGTPSELEPAICAALKDLGYPNYDRLMSELAEQHGMMASPLPDESKGGEVADLGRLTARIGKMYEAIAPAIADGIIDEKDAPRARAMLTSIADVESLLLTWRRQVHNIMPAHDATVTQINP